MNNQDQSPNVDKSPSASCEGAKNGSPTSVADFAGYPKTPERTTPRPSNAVIRLNVGGEKFTTSQATLCRVPGSLLEAMFSGRHECPAAQDDHDGSFFIDRDGTHFRHIINFLRVGGVTTLPTDPVAKEELAVEADYYGLEALVRAIRMPQVDIAQHLPPEVLAVRRDEDALRKAFAKRDTDGFDPYRGLLPLFCPDNGIQPLPITYEKPMTDMYESMGSLRKKRPDGTPVTVNSLTQFQSNFNREYPNVLNRLASVLIEEPVIIAGGAVLRALTASRGVRTADWWGQTSDIDLFLYGVDPEEANRIARRIFYALAVDNEKWVVVRSRGVINIHSFFQFDLHQKIQVVLRIYDSPTEVLLGFDCDCCCCAYDGREVWLTPRCVSALRTGTNVLNPLHAWPNKPSYELRLAKYAYRGFGVAIPGLEKKRIDFDRIRGNELGARKGLARLLKVTFEMESPPDKNTSITFPRAPKDIEALRYKQRTCYSDDEILVNGFAGYDDVGPVIVPRVFCQSSNELDEPAGRMWYYCYMEDFPCAGRTKDEAWEEIEDAGDDAPDGVSSRLAESWDLRKRSREYLNAEMDSYDLDNLYYCQAYDSAS